MHTVLSYGMGVESSAILVRWAEDPAVRPCPLEDLILIREGILYKLLVSRQEERIGLGQRGHLCLIFLIPMQPLFLILHDSP